MNKKNTKIHTETISIKENQDFITYLDKA